MICLSSFFLQVYCDHFLKGKCLYGDGCFKIHAQPPLYKQPFKPNSEENFNNIKLNNWQRDGENNSVSPEIFMSDSEESLPELPQTISTNRVNIKQTRQPLPRESPANLFELLDNSNDELSESESETDKPSVEETIQAKNKKHNHVKETIPVVDKKDQSPPPALTKTQRKKFRKANKKVEDEERVEPKTHILKGKVTGKVQDTNCKETVHHFNGDTLADNELSPKGTVPGGNTKAIPEPVQKVNPEVENKEVSTFSIIYSLLFHSPSPLRHL